ncbi:MAG: phosphotransferase [Thermoleophilaceae bacterium]|nr:phosphotransferase [Thermoleophilaceae bacterium]
MLRDSGYSVEARSANGGVDAVLFDTEDLPDAEDLRSAMDELREGGVISIAVAGGRVEPPSAVPTVVRIAQLLLSPIETARALAGARKTGRALRELGLESKRMATGDRSRSRYGLGRGGWVRRLRTPVGFVLTGSRGPTPPSLLQTAIERAQGAAGVSLEPVCTNVFESGKVVVDLRGPGGEEFFMRLAAGPSRRPLEASVVAVNALAGSAAPAVVRDRLVVPLAQGSVGPLHYSLEPNARGSHPWRMTGELWDQALEFLIELFGVDTAGSMAAERGPAAHGERMADYVSAEDRQALPSIVAEVERRLADVPRGQSHGDFWSENFLVRNGRLDTVLDWEWSGRDALPLLDLFDLIALSRRRVKDLTPGERFTEVLWPLVRAGGDERIHHYCRATGVSPDLQTLEGLAVAYWLNRVARQLHPLAVFLQREGWAQRNLHGPIQRLVQAGW